MIEELETEKTDYLKRLDAACAKSANLQFQYNDTQQLIENLKVAIRVIDELIEKHKE